MKMPKNTPMVLRNLCEIWKTHLAEFINDQGETFTIDPLVTKVDDAFVLDIHALNDRIVITAQYEEEVIATVLTVDDKEVASETDSFHPKTSIESEDLLVFAELLTHALAKAAPSLGYRHPDYPDYE